MATEKDKNVLRMPPRPITLTPTHPLRRPNNFDACVFSTAHKRRLAPDHSTVVIRSFSLPRAVALTLDFVFETHGSNISIRMSLRVYLDPSVIRISFGAFDLSFDARDEVEVAVKGSFGS